MPLKLGSTTVGSLYVGSTKISEAYLGSTCVYSSAAPAPVFVAQNPELKYSYNAWILWPTFNGATPVSVELNFRTRASSLYTAINVTFKVADSSVSESGLPDVPVYGSWQGSTETYTSNITYSRDESDNNRIDLLLDVSGVSSDLASGAKKMWLYVERTVATTGSMPDSDTDQSGYWKQA